MKKLLILFVLIPTIFAHSQTPSVTISDKLEVDGKTMPVEKILGNDGKYFYLYGEKKGKIYLVKLDTKFKVIASNIFDPDDIQKKTDVVDIHLAKNEIRIISEIKDKKEGKIYNYVWSVNTSSLSISNPVEILAVSQKVVADRVFKISLQGIGFHENKHSDDREIIYSEDTSKMAIISSLPPEEKSDGKYDKSSIAIFDEKLNKMWTSTLSTPEGYQFYEPVEKILGSDGSFYSFGRAYNTEKDMKKKRNGTSIIMAYNTSGVSKKITLDLPDKKIDEARFKWKNGRLICAGFYENKTSKKEIIEGISYIELNSDGSVFKESYKEFSDEFIAEVKKTRAAAVEKNKDGDLGLSGNFEIRKIIQHKNGKTYILAEEAGSFISYEYQTDAKGNSYRVAVVNYLFGNKIVCSIDSAGKFEWLTNIPTYMLYYSEKLGTYGSALINDKIHLVYSDNEVNIAKKLTAVPERATKLKKAATALTSIDINTGAAVRKKLIDAKDDEFMLYPYGYTTIGNEMIFLGGKMKLFGVDNKLARITIK